MTRARSRCLLFCAAFVLASAWQSTALGLTVIAPEPEHDWTVRVAEYRFGLEQVDWGASRTTTIYWGSGTVETELLAWTIVAAAAGAVAATIAVGGIVFAMFARRMDRKGAVKDGS